MPWEPISLRRSLSPGARVRVRWPDGWREGVVARVGASAVMVQLVGGALLRVEQLRGGRRGAQSHAVQRWAELRWCGR